MRAPFAIGIEVDDAIEIAEKTTSDAAVGLADVVGDGFSFADHGGSMSVPG
jgi:hypothetical protein